MAMVTRAKIPLIRAVIVFAAFCGMTLLWIASEGILPESNLSSAIRGMVCVTLFILTLDISMQLSEPGRLQSSAPGDDESLSSSVSNQHEAEPTSTRTSDQNKDSKSQKELETTRSLAAIDDQVLDSVAAGLEAERRDEELWAKLLITVDGAEARKEAINIRLGAKRLQRKAEEKRLKAAQRRSNVDATRNTLITR